MKLGTLNFSFSQFCKFVISGLFKLWSDPVGTCDTSRCKIVHWRDFANGKYSTAQDSLPIFKRFLSRAGIPVAKPCLQHREHKKQNPAYGRICCFNSNKLITWCIEVTWSDPVRSQQQKKRMPIWILDCHALLVFGYYRYPLNRVKDCSVNPFNNSNNFTFWYDRLLRFSTADLKNFLLYLPDGSDR